MVNILSIDCATGRASICLSRDQEILAYSENMDQMDHAAWLHSEIAHHIKIAGLELKDIQAVAITAGPGSYTGLRVAMAAAKGLCYSLGIPLIAENTLKVMAFAVKDGIPDFSNNAFLICPMIDARRMEVFTATYTPDLGLKMPPQAMVLNERSFDLELSAGPVIFSGTGTAKLQTLTNSTNAIFSDILISSKVLAKIALNSYNNHHFTDLAYSEPEYVKEFFTTAKQVQS